MARAPDRKPPRWLRLLARLAGATAGGAAPSPPRRARRRRRRTTAPDFQRSRVYRWEAGHVLPHSTEPISLDACRALVREAYLWAEAPIARTAGWAPPEVTDGRGRRHASGSREVIKLPRWARTRPVVLHECAHGLARDKHGPEFVAVYLDLLERFLGLGRAGLVASLTAEGVRFAPRPGAAPGAPKAARPRPA